MYMHIQYLRHMYMLQHAPSCVSTFYVAKQYLITIIGQTYENS